MRYLLSLTTALCLFMSVPARAENPEIDFKDAYSTDGTGDMYQWLTDKGFTLEQSAKNKSKTRFTATENGIVMNTSLFVEFNVSAATSAQPTRRHTIDKQRVGAKELLCQPDRERGQITSSQALGFSDLQRGRTAERLSKVSPVVLLSLEISVVDI